MTRLAPASSVRERTRRERESGSRARGTRRRRPARDATAAAAVASRGEPRRPARRRRSPGPPRTRPRTRDRPARPAGAPEHRPRDGAGDRVARGGARRAVRMALCAPHPARPLAPRPARGDRSAGRRRARRPARAASRPRPGRRVGAAPPSDPHPRRDRRGVGTRGRGAAGPHGGDGAPHGPRDRARSDARDRLRGPAPDGPAGPAPPAPVEQRPGARLAGGHRVHRGERRARRHGVCLARAPAAGARGPGPRAACHPAVRRGDRLRRRSLAVRGVRARHRADRERRPRPRRHVVRQVLTRWTPAACAVILLVAGASLALPTGWILVAAPLGAVARIAAKWAAVRYGRGLLQLTAVPPDAGLATAAQGAAAVALGLNFAIMYDGGGVLTTVVLGVAVAQLAAPPLLRLVLGATPAPLTQAPALPELSRGRSTELTT